MAHPRARQLVARLAVELLTSLSIQCIGGLEIGAIALATAISDYGLIEAPRREWRTFVVRKQLKDHGLGKLIEGAFRPGDHALIVDDVLTSGGSVFKAIAAAREAGMHVNHALVIVDREEQDGRARAGYPTLSHPALQNLRRPQPGQAKDTLPSMRLQSIRCLPFPV